MHHCFHTACFFLLQILGYTWQIQRKDTIKTGWLTILANLWASLTLSTSIITSSSWVGKAGSFFPIKLSIRWKSSTSYLWLYGHQTHLLAAVTFLSKPQYCTTYSTMSKWYKNGNKWKQSRDVIVYGMTGDNKKALLTEWRKWWIFQIVLLWLFGQPCEYSPVGSNTSTDQLIGEVK